MQFTIILFTFANLLPTVTPKIHLKINEVSFKKIPRFWTNTGLCPPAPIDNSTALSQFFTSSDMKTNLALVSALPNAGIKYVRIHWLLQLLLDDVSISSDNIKFNWKYLDEILSHLNTFNLRPHIEFMMLLPNGNNSIYNTWFTITTKFLQHCHDHYGITIMSKWRFETWNEPDLKSYNLLNFTEYDYEQYVYGIHQAMQEFSKANNLTMQLRGPAGLFKNRDTHKFCWSAIEKCNENIKNCPFDVITFHRKGHGRFYEIVDGTKQLIDDLLNAFPNIRDLPFSNNEADPFAGWSKSNDDQSNIKYGVNLMGTVFFHWDMMYRQMRYNIESISHDNGFLSYHPYEFSQRTLFARFMMNNTNPPHTQFIEKPVYTVLGLLSYIGKYGSQIRVHSSENIVSLISVETLPIDLYLGVFLFSINTNIFSQQINIAIHDLQSMEGELTYVIEYLDASGNDPYSVWNRYNHPFFPNSSVRYEMRLNQNPIMLSPPQKVENKKILLIEPFNIKTPWIILLRICSNLLPKPTKVSNVLFMKVNSNEVLIFWDYKNFRESSKCLKTYEIFHRAINSSDWSRITQYRIPFPHFQHQSSTDHGINGYYKIRAVDLFGNFGNFSDDQYYTN